MQNIWRILSLIPEYRSRIVRVILINAALSIFGLAFPFLFAQIVNAVVAAATHSVDIAGTTQKLINLLLAITVIRLAMVVFDYFQERLADSLWISIGATLRKRVYDRLETLSIDFFERNKAGEIMQRVQGAMEVSQWVMSLSQGVLVNILQNIAILAFMFYKSPLIGLVLLIVGPLNIWNAYRKTMQTKPIRRIWRLKVEQAMGKLNQSIGLAASVRSLSAEPVLRGQYNTLVDEWFASRDKEFRVQWRSNNVRGIINTVGLMIPVVIVSFGAINGQYSAGDVFLILSLAQNFLGGLMPISRLITSTGDVDTAAERIMTLLDEQPTIVDLPDAADLESLDTVEFRDVSFTYPDTKRGILENISFKLESGKSIALVGPSGSGKSTITKLILRFYEPTSGQVLINGQPIESFTQTSIRRHLGVVMQDVALFNDTIEANLKIAQPKATLAQLRAATRMSHADIFIDKLPDKYKTFVGERGIKLSGGEKQRVAIARAILRDPNLVILDEATSALDSQGERFVQEGLQHLMVGKTAIIIAHRLSTIMKSDQILVLKDGQIIERGEHSKLVNKKSGLYARLYELQTSGAIN